MTQYHHVPTRTTLYQALAGSRYPTRPEFFLSTQPVPSQKLKMTGYRVISISSWKHRMRNSDNKMKNLSNPKTENHNWEKWHRTVAVIFLLVPESHWLEEPHVAPDDDALLLREGVFREYALRLGVGGRHSKDPDRVRKNWKLLFFCKRIWKLVNRRWRIRRNLCWRGWLSPCSLKAELLYFAQFVFSPWPAPSVSSVSGLSLWLWAFLFSFSFYRGQ